jgi:hypothetical protein
MKKDKQLVTPKSHLPKGYPLPSDEEHKRFSPVFTRAFEIHEEAHTFTVVPGPHRGILSPVKGRTKISRAQYCDCYERAYRELKKNLNL